MTKSKSDEKRGRGRPAMYKSDEERKAARAQAARERRAALKAKGLKEIRRHVSIKPEKTLTSSIIDLSAVPNNQRERVLNTKSDEY